MPLNIGHVLGNRYRIDALLGQGGMGAVYRATDLRLNIPVAVKENLEVSPDAQRQFAREAGILASLHHANLPRVIDHFVIPGHGQYLAMDYVEGQDLGQILVRQGAIPEAQALGWIAQVLDALEYLHGEGVIHRDVKPANIKIDPRGHVFLVDFGLAKAYHPLLSTTAGARAVTPGFAPPEQYGMGRTDARSDLYSVGATLYALLTGQAPPDALETLTKQAHVTPPRQLNATISPQAETAILRAMQVTPTDRFQSAAEFRAALPAPAPTQGISLETVAQVPATPSPVHRPSLAGKGRKPLPRWFWLAAGGAAALFVVLLAVALAVSVGGGSASRNTPAAPTATPQPPTATPGPKTPQGGATQTRSKDGVVMVLVPAGEFLMGSTDADSIARADEKPQHKVTLDAFWIDWTEVTNASFRRFVSSTGYQTDGEKLGSCYLNNPSSSNWLAVNGADWQHPAGRSSNLAGPDDHPVVCVSWNDAAAYCEWAGARLPTEAEWEKAARGSEGRMYPWGNLFEPSRLSFCEKNCGYSYRDANADDGYALTAPVGSYPDGASPYGAADMAGNVWEWVSDGYDPAYYAASPAVNPTGPASAVHRVLRGGSWGDGSWGVRSAVRYANLPTERYDFYGFRCAASATSSP